MLQVKGVKKALSYGKRKNNFRIEETVAKKQINFLSWNFVAEQICNN